SRDPYTACRSSSPSRIHSDVLASSAHVFLTRTATTEIHTLSLHDALPISHSLLFRVEEGARIGVSGWFGSWSSARKAEVNQSIDSGCGLKPGTSSTQTNSVCGCVAESFRPASTLKSRTTRRDFYVGGTRAPVPTQTPRAQPRPVPGVSTTSGDSRCDLHPGTIFNSKNEAVCVVAGTVAMPSSLYRAPTCQRGKVWQGGGFRVPGWAVRSA